MTFRPGSLPARIAAFYAANPDEELTYEQMLVKFNATRTGINEAMKRLRAIGLLESVHVIRLRAKGSAAWQQSALTYPPWITGDDSLKADAAPA